MQIIARRVAAEAALDLSDAARFVSHALHSARAGMADSGGETDTAADRLEAALERIAAASARQTARAAELAAAAKEAAQAAAASVSAATRPGAGPEAPAELAERLDVLIARLRGALGDDA